MKLLFIIFIATVMYFPVYPTVGRKVSTIIGEEYLPDRITRRLRNKRNGEARWSPSRDHRPKIWGSKLK